MYNFKCRICNKEHIWPLKGLELFCYRLFNLINMLQEANCSTNHSEGYWEASNFWCSNCGKMLK